MALIRCPECGAEVSERAEACPNCGFPIASRVTGDSPGGNVCPECMAIITSYTGICSNCGYIPQDKLNANNKKSKTTLLIVLGAVAVVILAIIAVTIIVGMSKGSKYIDNAVVELVEYEGKMPDIKKIYYSDEVSDGSMTIDYVYRVYIEYSKGSGEKSALYVVDNKGKTYFITKYSSEKLAGYLTIAKAEIYGVEGYLEPSGTFSELGAFRISSLENEYK